MHPIHRVRLERLCAVCEGEREGRLVALEEESGEVRFEPERCKWRFQGAGGDGGGGSGRGSKAWEVGAVVGGWWRGGGGEVVVEL